MPTYYTYFIENSLLKATYAFELDTLFSPVFVGLIQPLNTFIYIIRLTLKCI